MAKIIKKIVSTLLIVTAVLIFIPATAAILLRAPKFQTFVVHRFSEYFSRKTGAQISVREVSYTFFNKLVLYDVLVKDQNLDTLLSVRQAAIRIKEFKPSDQRYRLGKVDLYEPDFRMIKDTSGIMNLTWFIDALSSDKANDTLKKFSLSFGDIDIFDGALSIKDKSDSITERQGLINFKDLRVTSLEARVRNLKIIPDSVSFNIRKMAFTESKGLKASGVEMDGAIVGNALYFTDIYLRTDSSKIIADRISIIPKDTAAWSDFLNRVSLDIGLQRSAISISDLAFFAAPLSGIYETIILSGRFSGTVAEIRGRNIELDFSTATRLKCDFDISGLPVASDIFMFVDFTELRTSADDFEGLRLKNRKPVEMPPVAHDLGNISFVGNFTGFTTDFVAFGTLETERGSFSTDLSFRPDKNDSFSFNGLLKANNVDLGYLTRNNELFGGLWLKAEVDGSMKSFQHLNANINGVIDSVVINDYQYRNVSLEGKYGDKVWDGTVQVRDRNIKMDILGRFDLSDLLPEFDFTMNLAYADLYKLHLQKNDTQYFASALLTANFKGNNIDNLDGELRLINSTLKNSNGEITIYDFLLSAGYENGVPLLSLRSDFADGEIRGKHTYASIGTAVKTAMAGMFPTKYKLPAGPEKLNENNFNFDIRFKKIDKLSDFFGTGITVADGTSL